MTRSGWTAGWVAALLGWGGYLRAQTDSQPTQGVRAPALVTIGSDQEDRLRLRQLLGRSSLDGFLLRSASSLTPSWPAEPSRFRWAVVPPDLRLVHNSTLPYSLNDGALWAGRGWNGRLRAGARARWGPVWLIAAPELLYSQNLDFVQPDPRRSHAIPPGRSAFSSPWHTVPLSADLPLRSGDRPFATVDPGQTSLGVDLGPVTVGAATESQWWGPGIRNAIVFSDNAAGVPHLFVRSSRPLLTGAGVFEGRWLVGGLAESPYFDDDPTNDLRSLAALGLTWRPKWVPSLTLGLTRAVYAPAGKWYRIPPRFFNVLAATGRPNAKPLTDSSQVPGRDQVFSLIARWVFPTEGFEAYAEWARTELPASLRDLLTAPNHTEGYTLGLQWARALARGGAALRLQAEATYLGQSTTFRDRPEGIYYTSRAVIQGYTQRGQIVGAGIGPGASSQWLALDYLPGHWLLGARLGRIRWEDDVLYTLPDGDPSGDKWCSHDVSLFGGVRAQHVGKHGRVGLTLTTGTRRNVFFRHFSPCGADDDRRVRTDIRNTTIELTVSPAW